ncbi:UNKNOWN [Stylonychia lemnae]|uniref:Uncharacterized protein n=1 Tax=Stylonychia lemnae TaxID=5949 RepID=A0A078AZ58_STYLE|nr:UNKNOWN [Stylonychia lemnae]|eukprot:CDW87424.1 UNKNOWN [Stylonychia lemnae]
MQSTISFSSQFDKQLQQQKLMRQYLNNQQSKFKIRLMNHTPELVESLTPTESLTYLPLRAQFQTLTHDQSQLELIKSALLGLPKIDHISPRTPNLIKRTEPLKMKNDNLMKLLMN